MLLAELGQTWAVETPISASSFESSQPA